MGEVIINNVKVTIQEEAEKQGVIIDVWNKKTGDHVDGITIWYDDLTNDNN